MAVHHAVVNGQRNISHRAHQDRILAADLTDEFRFELNPEGILYYKIWNGHPPAMPAFKSKFTKDETWTLVEYVKSLRKP